jgi:Tn3 transposase DDE domain-containing protein
VGGVPLRPRKAGKGRLLAPAPRSVRGTFRFTRNNVQHPTYKAFAELGKAVKTIFLCRYLNSEDLRREINDGLNVVEQWNGANVPPGLNY